MDRMDDSVEPDHDAALYVGGPLRGTTVPRPNAGWEPYRTDTGAPMSRDQGDQLTARAVKRVNTGPLRHYKLLIHDDQTFYVHLPGYKTFRDTDTDLRVRTALIDSVNGNGESWGP